MKKVQLGGYKEGSQITGYALVDYSDFEVISRFKWHLNDEGYAVTRGRNNQKGSLLRMHRLLLGNIAPKMDVDHINRNRLDNRRSNLRVVTRSKNLRNGVNPLNTSGLRGIYWHKSAKKWCAEFKIEKKKFYLGLFEDIKEAARVYLEAKEKYGY